MTNDKWTRMLRPFVIVACVLALYISAQFSVDGFNFQVPEKKWIGWVLAGIIIVLQMAWARAGDNLTVFTVGMFSYIYGITTNVIGIAFAMFGRLPEKFTEWLLPLTFGIFLEITPEPFLAWAIGGDTSSDPIGKIMKRLFGYGIDSLPPKSMPLGNLPRKRF